MIRAVVFDFDGTLVDSNALKRAAYDTVVRGHPSGAALVAEAIARSEPDRRAVFELYARLQSARNVVSLDSGILVEAYSKIVDESVAQAPEIPGAGPLLSTLARSKLSCHVSSATPADSLERIVDARGWTRYFVSVNGRPETKLATLKRISSQTGICADQFAVVGDGADDLESAAQFGARFFPVGEARGTHARMRIFRLEELPAAFASATAARGPA
jgi:phosphoglycolate phosphatase